MCLRTKQHHQKIADKNIYVYKVVVIRETGAYTPYKETPIPIETLNGQKAFKAEGSTQKTKDRSFFVIEGGNIHTYAYVSDAWDNANYAATLCGHFAVYECIIPKGTKYYYGHTWGTSSYASKQIRFVRKLNPPQKYLQPELDLR